MAKSKKIEGDLVKVDLTVTNTDIVAIKMSQFEMKLTQLHDDYMKKLNNYKNDLAAKQKELDFKIKEIINQKFESKLNIIRSSFKDIDVNINITVTSTYSLDNKVINVCINFSRHYSGFNQECTINFTPEIESIFKCIDDINECIGKTQSDLFEVKKKFAQISTIERQVRAKVAVNTLSKSEEGRLILDQINNIAGLPNFDLSLPEPK